MPNPKSARLVFPQSHSIEESILQRLFNLNTVKLPEILSEKNIVVTLMEGAAEVYLMSSNMINWYCIKLLGEGFFL